LVAGGKPLIAWQIEALSRAGFRDIVINAAWLAPPARRRTGRWRRIRRAHPLVARTQSAGGAGGIATALPLLPPGPVLIVSGDIWTRFDYATLASRAGAMARNGAPSRVHLVMVPNPPFHPEGDFILDDRRIALGEAGKMTFGNIGSLRYGAVRELPRGARSSNFFPSSATGYPRGWVSGERFDGPWANVGTPAELEALDQGLSRSVSHHRWHAPHNSAQGFLMTKKA
jgi:MurNAc alpha-1-phosphate uridylyltransferase